MKSGELEISRRWVAFLVAILVVNVAGVAAASEQLESVSVGDIRSLIAEADDGRVYAAVSAAIRSAPSHDLDLLHADLLTVATDRSASIYGREMACRLLELCPMAGDAMALSGLLAEAELAHAARIVVEDIPGAEADRVLIVALDLTSGEIRNGIADSLGIRRSAEAVVPLSILANGQDLDSASAALRALAEIGSDESLAALKRVRPPRELEAKRIEAMLRAASRILDDGGDPDFVADNWDLDQLEPPVRLAAFRLMVRLDRAGRVDRMSRAFSSNYPWMQAAGAGAIEFLDATGQRRDLVSRATAFPPESQGLLISAMTGRGWSEVLPLARAAVAGSDPGARGAAVEALGRLGNISDLPALLGVVANDDALRDAAITAVTSLRDPAVDEVLLQEFADDSSPLRQYLPPILVRRRSPHVLDTLLAAGANSPTNIAVASYRALGEIGGPDIAFELIRRRSEAPETLRGEIDRAIVAIGRGSPPNTVSPLLAEAAATPEMDTTAREDLFAMLGAIADDAALQFLAPLVEATPPDSLAFRTVLGWRRSDALVVLESVVRREQIAMNDRLRAWQAMFRIARAANNRWNREAGMALVERCFDSALRPEDRLAVVEYLGSVPDERALDDLNRWKEDPELAEAARAAIEQVVVGIEYARRLR